MLEIPRQQYVLTGKNRRRHVDSIVRHNRREHSCLNVPLCQFSHVGSNGGVASCPATIGEDVSGGRCRVFFPAPLVRAPKYMPQKQLCVLKIPLFVLSGLEICRRSRH